MKQRKNKLVLALAVVWLAMAGQAWCVVVYVDADATGANNGSSWSNAYTSVQSALSTAGIGDEIWVAEGTYTPGTARTNSFQLRADVSLCGGFAGTETLRSQRNWTNHVTALSGDIGTPGDPSDNAYHVLKGANGAVLDGFTVSGGCSGTNYPDIHGAGLLNSNASPQLANCRFVDNSAYFAAGNGGAIFNLNSSPVISNCMFSGNSAYWGGAICNLHGGTVTVVNCEFTGNTADIGGAINNEGSTVTIRDCRFIGNGGDGGGINNRGCSPTILNCVFAQNEAALWGAAGMRNVAATANVQNCVFVGNYTREGNGAGLHNVKGSPQVVNCTFYGNAAELGQGGGIYNDSVTGVSIKNCILWSNLAGVAGSELFNTNSSPAVSFSDIQGGINGSKCGGIPSSDAGGNIAGDPRFVNAADQDGADDRFATVDDGLQLDQQLTFESPCIDSGTSAGAPSFDVTGLARPKYFGFDMGSYEYNPDFDGDGLNNLLEYRMGSNPHAVDSDSDGLNDYVEYCVYGTSPTNPDTDGDGMPDGWEITYGMNPTVNDSSLDADNDWLTNLAECQSTNNPTLPDTNSDGTNDYEHVMGQQGARYTYDRIDRLVGAEYERGLSLGYAYDGNGNILRQISFATRDTDDDGLPDLWEFLNGLSWTNAASHGGMYGDADGDGWSNFQEWQAATSPTNAASVPDIFGSAGMTAATFQVGFTPSNFVMAVGQLDGTGPEEIVVGADGNPGTWTNCVWILSQTFTGWTTQCVEIGKVGITSISIGQPTNTDSAAIYIGTRQTGGTGTIIQVALATNGWQKTTLASSTNEEASVLGVTNNAGILVSLSPTNAAARGLYGLSCVSNVWSIQSVDTNSLVRGLGTLAYLDTSSTTGTALRLVGTNGICLGVVSMSEPPASNRLVWRGLGLNSGFPRPGTNAVSVFYAFDDDVNLSGKADAGDDFVLAEYLVTGTNWHAGTVTRLTISASQVGQSYGLACLDYTNGSGEVFFTGEPDGSVYSWSVPNATGALQRQLFSAKYAGKTWHQLMGHKGIETGGEALAGLCVDSASPATCSLIYWLPQTTLWTPASIKQTPPITRILDSPNSGGGVSLVKVKIWDAEGNASLPYLQYSYPGTNNWSDATIITLDSLTYSYAMTVAAIPEGSIHEFLWNSATNLGPTFSGNVYLRTRSQDLTLTGEWSEPVVYHVAVTNDSNADGIPDAWAMTYNLDPLATNGSASATGDADGDGVNNLMEYIADTNPTNTASLLEITGVAWEAGGLRLNWKGGVQAWQFIQASTNLSATNGTWQSIHTNPPPTDTTNTVLDLGATNRTLFYRIKAAR